MDVILFAIDSLTILNQDIIKRWEPTGYSDLLIYLKILFKTLVS